MSAWDDRTDDPAYDVHQDDVGQEIAEHEGGAAPIVIDGRGHSLPIMAASSVHAGHPWAFSYRPLTTDDPIELLRRHVMDFGSCDARETCDCSDGQAWRWLIDHGIIDV